jgi:hypothetical protein
MAETIRLLGGNNDGTIVELPDGRQVVEMSSEPGCLGRYMRTDDAEPGSGYRVYVSIGSRTGAPDVCPTCVEYGLEHGQFYESVEENIAEWTRLVRCRDCATLYEVDVASVGWNKQALDEAEARVRWHLQ